MRFIIIYKNDAVLRAQIEKTFAEKQFKDFDFLTKRFVTQEFQTHNRWPTPAEIDKIPLNIQCEEVERKNGKLVSIRRLVIDVEIIA